MKKVWFAHPKGKWVGGLAVIIATSREQALGFLPYSDWELNESPTEMLSASRSSKIGLVAYDWHEG